MPGRSTLSASDRIEELDLSLWAHYALRKAGVRTVGELNELARKGKLGEFSSIGPLDEEEILAKLDSIRITSEAVRVVSPRDTIEQLELSGRALNALAREGVKTIGQLSDLVADEQLQAIRQIGSGTELEILTRLALVKVDPDLVPRPNPVPMSESAASNVSEKRMVQPYDHIAILDFSTRTHNALMRGGVTTIGELVQLVRQERLQDVRNIGELAEREVIDKLETYHVDWSDIAPTEKDVTEQQEAVDRILISVVDWQVRLVRKQIEAGLLHQNAKYEDTSIEGWLSSNIDLTSRREALEAILSRYLNICDEVDDVLNHLSDRELQILVLRHGEHSLTLDAIGTRLGLSRERVRQLLVKLEKRILDNYSSIASSSIRIKSALQLAADMGMDITYTKWLDTIRASGLLGVWRHEHRLADPASMLQIVISVLLSKADFELPANFRTVFDAALKGRRNVSAALIPLLESSARDLSRQIRRHARFSGAVSIKWLETELRVGHAVLRILLDENRYTHVDGDWYAPRARNLYRPLNKNQPFHRALRKMFQFCGPLSLEDIASGLRSAISRTDYPIPPISVLKIVLRQNGYRQQQNGKWCWDGPMDEELSASEALIWQCFERYGPVVSHAELAEAFIRSELSFPSLHAALGRSPLFDKVEMGLYKVRGSEVSRDDIQRALATTERAPSNLTVDYTRSGEIVVGIRVGTLALGNGTIQIVRTDLPNLSGTWTCKVDGTTLGDLTATETEFRHLRAVFNHLSIEPDERLVFKFNTWDRTVTVERDNT